MNLPKNKYTLLAAVWLVLLWYGLLRESGGRLPAPPFPHFDKAVHFAIFFAQFWLAARAFPEAGRRPPYRALALAALLLAAATETAQWLFTATRSGDFYDAAADSAGAAAALLLAGRVRRRAV
ncbi:MAG: VanZ family protein [Neisseria sp.]|nr:VanZ family protein [Neisseria sp.]